MWPHVSSLVCEEKSYKFTCRKVLEQKKCSHKIHPNFVQKNTIFYIMFVISEIILAEKSWGRTNAATSFILILSTFSLCSGSHQPATIYNPLTANANKNICNLSGNNIITCFKHHFQQKETIFEKQYKLGGLQDHYL